MRRFGAWLAVLISSAAFLGLMANVLHADIGPGGIRTVTDGVNTSSNPATLDFTSGCTVTPILGVAEVACSGGGGSVSVTAATPTVVITPSPGTGTFTVGTTAPDTVHTSSATTANPGGEDDYNAASLTATLATLASGQTLQVVTTGNGLTIALGGQTVIGLPLATTLHPYGFYGFTYNSAGSLTGYGFPGFGTITSGALMKFTDGSGAATAATAGTDYAAPGTTQTFTAAQSFAEVHGTAYAPTLTANNYNAAITDCGKTLLLPTGTAPTVTLPNVNPATGECSIKMVQMTSGTSLYTIQAASGGTLVSANSYTHTAKQYATIVVTLIVPSGSAATWALSGEGS